MNVILTPAELKELMNNDLNYFESQLLNLVNTNTSGN